MCFTSKALTDNWTHLLTSFFLYYYTEGALKISILNVNSAEYLSCVY